MTIKYKFQDGHPTGGLATVIITEPQVLEYMRQFIDNKDLTDTQCIMKFSEARKATPVAVAGNYYRPGRVCSKGDKCCKNTASSRKGTEL